MDKDTFQQNLLRATDFVILFTQKSITNHLPEKSLCLINLRMSYDGNPLVDDEEIFPDDKVPMGQKYPIPLRALEAVEYLWKNGKIPEWINITVFTYDNEFTYLALDCCGRFTAIHEHLYHIYEGYPPFHVLGPALPPGWVSGEKKDKFDLFWHGKKPVIE